MRKNLFFIATLFCSICAFAQGWVKPVPEASELQLTEDTSNPSIYYLYNKDAAAFFNRGNDWGTRSSYADTGIPVYVTPDDSEAWDKKTVFIWNLDPNENVWKQLFIDSETFSYVDWNGQKNHYWEIEKQKGNLYHIFGGKKNPLFTCYDESYAGCYFGIKTQEESTIIYPLLDPNVDKDASIDWIFITEEGYAAFLAKKQVYSTAMKLGESIKEASDLGLDVTEEKKVFNDTSSDIETLESAIASVVAKINKLKEENATPDNPQDVSSAYIDERDFEDEQIGSWLSSTNAIHSQANGTAGKLGNDTYFFENWNDGVNFSGKMYYHMNSLPNGIYQFGINVSLNGGEGYVYANDSKTYTNSNQFSQQPITVLTAVNDATMECGLEIINNSTYWAGIDDVQLIYYGNSLESYKYWLNIIIKDAPDFSSDIYAQKTVIETYNNLVGKIDGLSTKEDILAFVPAFTEALEKVTESYNAYLAYQKVMQEVEKAFTTEEFNGETADYLSDYLISYEEEILQLGEMTAEEITAEASRIAELLKKARTESLKPGSNATHLLVNPNFDEKLNGWDYDTRYNFGSAGGMDYNPCAEDYNCHFDFYQEVKVPNGVYLLKVQGFYRPLNSSYNTFENYKADPATDEIYSFIYVNATQKAICNQASHYYLDNLEGNCDEVTSPEGEPAFVPGGMNSSSAAFANGDYENEVYGVVTDGHLRVGIRSTEGYEDGRWTIWDNFRLTYYGKDADALKEIISQAIDVCNEYLNEENPMNAEVLINLENAITNANDTARGHNGNAMYNAYITLQDALEAAKQSTETYADLDDAIHRLEVAMDSYQDTATEEALIKAEQIYEEAVEAYEYGYWNEEQIAQKIEELNAAKACIMIVDASDDEPADYTAFIINPDFETGNIKGWDITSTNFDDIGYQDNNAHYNDEIVISRFGQIWKSGATIGDGHIQQVVKYLPEGTYQLDVDAISANQLSDDTTTGISLFALESLDGAEVQKVEIATDDWTPEHFNFIFKKQAADSDVTLGILVESTNGNWIAVDNFRLTYFGKNSKKEPTEIKDVIKSVSKQDNKIFNILGQNVKTLQKGINIIGGKKIYVK